MRGAGPSETQKTVDGLINTRNGNLAAYSRAMWQLQTKLRTLVPDAARREAISKYLDNPSGPKSQFTGEEWQAINTTKDFFNQIGKEAVDQKVVRGLIDNYVTHIVDWSQVEPSKIEAIKEQIFGNFWKGGSGRFTTKTPYAKARKYATFDELQKALKDSGLTIKTTDIHDIVGLYGNSMRKAIENKRLIDTIGGMKDEIGRSLIQDAGKAPRDYMPIDHVQLLGKSVHPEIAPAMKFIMEQNRPDVITNALYGVSMVAKRLNISATLFHAKSLTDSFIGAGAGNIFAPKQAMNLWKSVPQVLKIYKEGGGGDIVDWGIRNGLHVSLPDDVNPVLVNDLISHIGTMVDDSTGLKLGKYLSDKYVSLNTKMDHITWNYAWTGFKLATFGKEFARLIQQNAEDVAAGKGPELTKDVLAAKAATYANDLFGGLDWFRVATEANAAWRRNLSLAALSPKGRRWMQIAVFAPDWTLSTFRGFYKAIPGVIRNDRYTQKMYQKYVARSALYYFMVGNALNYALSGHSILENKDPTRIDLGDGRTMQFSKHMMEFPEWMMKPKQMALNKLGILPSEVLEQTMNKDYLSAYGSAPPISNPIIHALKRFMPIPGQQALEGSVESGISGWFGFPIYGQTNAEKRRKKFEQEIKREYQYGRK